MRLNFVAKRLGFKLILYIFSSIAAIFCVIFAYNYTISRQIVEKNLRLNAEGLTMTTVLKVDKVLSSVQKITDNYARILETSDPSDQELLAVLRQLVDVNPEIFGAAMAFEPNGRDPGRRYFAPYFYRTGKGINLKYLGDEQYDYFLMDWYQVPRELQRPVWNEPYFDEGGGDQLMTTYSVPIYREKDGKRTLRGILTADISLDWLQGFIHAIHVTKTGYGFMISSNGTIVTHPMKEMIMNETIFSIADEQQSAELREIGRNMVNGKTSFAEFEYRNIRTGQLSWIAYAPVPVNGWSIGIVFPVDEFMSDVNRLILNIFILALAGLLIILLVIILISRSITRPLRSLTRAAGKFAEGDFGVKLPAIRTQDEIGHLSSAFASMQEALAATIGDLREASEKLRVSNEQLEEYNRTLEQKVEERTSELQEKNRALDSAFTNVRTLSEIGKHITSTLNIADIQEIVYQHVNQLLDATSFLIMLYNEKEAKLECKLSIENGERLPSFEISMEETNRFAVWCVVHAKPLFMNDVDNEYMQYVPGRAKPKAGRTVSSLIYLPMMIENRVIGVISAQSFEKNAYTQYQADMLNNLANYTAIAFENALAYEKINRANAELKAAQTQLVQSEKMASLGQLTAGIAHEIKNPLNFVNNFAELTVELADELGGELAKLSEHLSEKDRENLVEITADIRSNARKINEHGKRADSIVRGMLLHSRGKAGDKQPTDLNAVLAEYVNLAYHGMRAQDNTFNIKIEANYDEAVGMVNVVPQNISRVFLNIINNACYSTNQKKKELRDAYFPLLEISTKRLDGRVEVRIRDNGKGIPQDILEKIFNPFFTTKPAGHGTGLGLSLSYDIVVQEHRGELKVESAEGEFAEFRITLPA